MRVIVVAAITAAITTPLSFVGFQYLFKTSTPGIPPSAIGELTAQIASNQSLISALRKELRDMQDLSNMRGNFGTADAAVAHPDSINDDLLERLETIEKALAKPSTVQSTTGEQRKAVFDVHMKEHSLPREVLATQVYASAESHFENDAGKPLGNYASAIDDALHSVDGIDLMGVDCRESICKITYGNSTSISQQEQSDIDSVLADQLMFGAEGRMVELRYANDSIGNNVIYAELK